MAKMKEVGRFATKKQAKSYALFLKKEEQISNYKIAERKEVYGKEIWYAVLGA